MGKAIFFVEDHLLSIRGNPLKIRGPKPRTGQLPLGYKIGRFGELVPDPDEQLLISRIREMATSISLNEIARRLNKENVPTKNGRRWHANTVRIILRASPLVEEECR